MDISSIGYSFYTAITVHLLQRRRILQRKILQIITNGQKSETLRTLIMRINKYGKNL